MRRALYIGCTGRVGPEMAPSPPGNVFIRCHGWKAPRWRRTEKKVHLRIDKDDATVSLKDVLDKIAEIQSKHPELDVFFDGDEYAICSRPRTPTAPPR